VKNNSDFATGFAWRRPDTISKGGSWLRDLALTLAVAVASSLFCLVGDAHTQQRPIQQSATTGGPAPVGPSVTESTAK
jgi:hypothetical protein